MQVQEAQRVQVMMDAKRTTPRHVMIKRLEVKDERIIKVAREKKLVTYRRVPIRYLISQKKLQARRDWQEIFKVMKSKDLQPRLFYPAKLSFSKEKT